MSFFIILEKKSNIVQKSSKITHYNLNGKKVYYNHKEFIMDVKKLKKIDIHAHAIPFPEYAPKWNQGHAWISGDDLIEIYDKLNVEKGVL